jgi:hypothetical protein
VQLIHQNDRFARATLSRPAALTVFDTRWIADAFADHNGRRLVVHPPVYPDEHWARRGTANTLVNLSEAKGAAQFYILADRFPSRPFLGVAGGYGQQDIRPGRSNVRIHDHTSIMRRVWGADADPPHAQPSPSRMDSSPSRR